MKTKIALFFGLFLLSNMSFAELKVGVVNMPTILKETPQTEKALKRLEQEFSPRKKQLDTQLNEIKSLDEKLSRDASIMSDTERGNLEKKILNKKRDFERTKEETSYDFNARRNEELGKLQRRIVEAIQAIAKEQNFDLILIDGVIFASDKIDITSQVQKKLSSMPE
ncbi:MAG: OmpH family outer membrane protein [Gammaproteobacteria bacterium]